MARLAVAVALLVLAGTGAAAAQQQPFRGVNSEAATARLLGLNRADRALLAPYLERGPVALVEFAEREDVPGIVFASRVEAPAAVVANVISDPAQYPRFMPLLDVVRVEGRHGPQTAYAWEWQTALFRLRGRNVMTMLSPPAGQESRGYRVAVQATGGDLGTGRMVWRVLPETPTRSLLILSIRLDLRDANYVARELSAAARSVNRSVNIGLSFEMLLGTKREAERRRGLRRDARARLVPRPRGERPPPLRRPQIDAHRLAPILARGDLVMLEMRGDDLAQVVVVGRMGLGRARVREVMTDPEAFGQALIPGSYATVRERRPDGNIVFDWGVDLPLVGTDGRMRMFDHGSLVEVEAISGALDGGRWEFDVVDLPWAEAVVLGWADFDLRRTPWLIRSLVSSSPDFGHGLTTASEIMVLRAIRSRSWRRHEDRTD